MDRKVTTHLQSYLKLNRAFSLVELLVVIVIISILIGLSANFGKGVNDSLELATKSSELVSFFNRARELAHVSNQPTQIRFYNAPSEFSGEPNEYNLIAVGHPEPPTNPNDPDFDNPDSWPFRETMTRLRLSNSIFIRVDRSDYSTLITGNENLGVIQGTESDPDLGTLQYSAISFSTDNQARLDPNQEWTLILVNRTNSDKPLAEVDFATLQLFPRTGRVMLIQK